MNNFITSSTGDGVKLRIKSLLLLIVPILNQFGVPLIGQDLDIWVDAAFTVVFGIVHAWGWVRAFRANKKPQVIEQV